MLQCLNAQVFSYEKGEAAVLEVDPAGYVYIVLSGQVHIIKENYHGSRSIMTKIMCGEILGEVFACAEEKNFMSAFSPPKAPE